MLCASGSERLLTISSLGWDLIAKSTSEYLAGTTSFYVLDKPTIT